MPKKSVFKKMFEEEFDVNKIHDEIVYQTKRRKKFNVPKTLKYCLPIVMLSFICGTLILNSKRGILKPNINSSVDYKDTININDMSSMGAMKIDADVRIVPSIDDSYFSILDNLKVPEDFDNRIYNAIYVRGPKVYSESSSPDYNYDRLNNFEFIYENTSNDRNITISFSDAFEPVRDYYFEEVGKSSKINDVQLTIYKYENSYLTKFNYQNYNFDIETSNVNVDELINLLKSIIK